MYKFNTLEKTHSEEKEEVILLSSNWQRLPAGSKNPKTGRPVRSQNAWYNPSTGQVDYREKGQEKEPSQAAEAEPAEPPLDAEISKIDALPPEKLAKLAKKPSEMPKAAQDAMKAAFLESMKDVVASPKMSPDEKYTWAKRQTAYVANFLGVNGKMLREELNAELKKQGVKIRKEIPKSAVEAGKKAFDPSKNASGVIYESIDNSENANYDKIKQKMAEVSDNLSKGKPVDITGLPEEFVKSVSDAYLASKEPPEEAKEEKPTIAPELPKKKEFEDNPDEGFTTEPPQSPESAATEELTKDREQKQTAEEINSGKLPSPEQAANAAIKESPKEDNLSKTKEKSKKQKNKELREAADKLLADAAAKDKPEEPAPETTPKEESKPVKKEKKEYRKLEDVENDIAKLNKEKEEHRKSLPKNPSLQDTKDRLNKDKEFSEKERQLRKELWDAEDIAEGKKPESDKIEAKHAADKEKAAAKKEAEIKKLKDHDQAILDRREDKKKETTANKLEKQATEPKKEVGPKDGDKDGNLTFRDGRWHNDNEEAIAEDGLSEPEVKQAKELVAVPPKSKGKAPKGYKPDLSPSGNKSLVLEPRGKEESFAGRKTEYTAKAKSFAEHKAAGMSDEDARYEAALDNRLSESTLKEISPIDKAEKSKKEKAKPSLSAAEIKQYKDEFGIDATGKTLEEANREVLKSKGIEQPAEDSPPKPEEKPPEPAVKPKEKKPAKKTAIAEKPLPKATEIPKTEEAQSSGGIKVNDKPFGKENPWHGRRESSLAAMRLLGDESEREYEKARSLNPTGGQIQVGSADFDNILKATVIDGYLRALRNGLPPEKAFEQAKQDGNESVANWNKHGHKSRASFGGSHELKRWDKAGESIAEDIHRKFLNNISEDDKGVSESEKTVALEKTIKETFKKLESEKPKDLENKKSEFLDSVTGNRSKEVVAEFESASGNDRQYRIVPKYNSINGLHFISTYDVPGDDIYDQDFSEKHESYEAAEKALGKHLATVKYGENMRVKSKIAESSRDEYREGVKRATEADRAAKEKDEAEKKERHLKNEESKYRFKDVVSKEKGKKVKFNSAIIKGSGDDAKQEVGEEISGTAYGNLAVHKEGSGKHAVYHVSHPKTGFKAGLRGFKTKEQAKEYAIALGKLDSFEFEDIKDMPKHLGRNPLKLMVAISDGEYADVEEIVNSAKK